LVFSVELVENSILTFGLDEHGKAVRLPSAKQGVFFYLKESVVTEGGKS